MDGRLHGNKICTYNFQEEVAEDAAGQGNIPWNERINVEEASEAEVMMLRDNFLKFAKDNFRTATVTILTKDYANEFKEVSSPLPSIDFHLQFIQATFVSWSRSDPRVTKEILKGKVLQSSSSNCFLFQSTKPEADESKRLLIGFSDVLGLEITEDSIVLDVKSLPKMERKVTYELRRHSATQNSIIEANVDQKSSRNASVNSKRALPPPRADPREFAFFFLWMANSRGRGHLSCQMPGGRDESRRQMPRYT